MSLATIDLVILGVYAVFIFGLAQWVSRDKGGEKKTSTDYFLASKNLPWWAIGASLIAANISAEQIIGMSGSGYVIGLGIASYEWMAALTLLIVGKFFLPIFLRNDIVTMPQFLQQRYGPTIRNVMAVFWLLLYVFVNVTSILWLGSIAVNTVTGLDQMYAIVAIGVFALAYQLWGGLKAVALTDIVQVALLVAGGLIIGFIALSEIGGASGAVGGFTTLLTDFPEKFDMILSPDNPNFKELPGIAVLLGGLWIMNISYWGFNQYIIQRALAAKSLGEAQKGIAFAAYLKLLMPVIVVLPGMAALIIAPNLSAPDQAYPTMMNLLPAGLKGLVFAALIAAIIASLASKVNSISTIFTLDLYAKANKGASESHLVLVGRIAAVAAMAIGILVARPLLGGFSQAFQFIQDFTGFFTPSIVVIFILGLFWKRASEAGALTAAIGGVALSGFMWWLDREGIFTLPFMNRVGVVFLVSLVAAIAVSLFSPPKEGTMQIKLDGVSYKTSLGFNIAGAGVIAFLIAVYAIWW
ncbi:sodium/sugar symporter [Brevundimonas subvibrioides]|uniref:SSS sodium solute transporter superfamily n=1 Tax=Brevundimonas subvibrioides (strain ATCC 15264 / DSM 4735 / LMG 14903 / NBRC 16000 / CB 81) TaxID=633149 RepID=D9QIR2_BRESC|nr:sodium/sugar symporter [Brevundimonas subvibrioides]ADL01395.1 SSS sodium solute transporter superfamily [Brevundimonas subvibrioides ATCC 15264]